MDRHGDRQSGSLTREECLTLLSQAGIGRVGVSLGGPPEIFPVHFCLIDDAIVFRTGEGTKLHAASRGVVVAFEVDEFEIDARCGWSVLVVGRSRRVIHPAEIHEARQRLQPDGWVRATGTVSSALPRTRSRGGG